MNYVYETISFLTVMSPRGTRFFYEENDYKALPTDAKVFIVFSRIWSIFDKKNLLLDLSSFGSSGSKVALCIVMLFKVKSYTTFYVHL